METNVIRRATLCQACEDKSTTYVFSFMFSHFGYKLLPASPSAWFISSVQCQGCGTTERGMRRTHDLVKLNNAYTNDAVPLFLPTDYDRQLASVIKISLEEHNGK